MVGKVNNVWKSDMAVSSVIGTSILLTITLLSICLMILYTAPVISDMQDIAKSQKIEQAFTVFDSKISKAALGESPLQTTSLSLMEENIDVDGSDESYNESRMKIIFLYSTSDWYDGFYQQRSVWNAWDSYENRSDFDAFDASMGKVRYYSGGRIIAYEGGGVWSKYPYGGTIMISPPEFHYNGETLSLPIMKVSGNNSIAGSSDVDIKVKSSNIPVVLYPNTSINSNFTNPLNCNKILIYVNSEFYDGWADYAETLTSTSTILDYENKTAIIEMDTLADMGTFPMEYSFKISGLNYSNPDPIHNLSFYYVSELQSASNFNPTGSALIVTSGDGKKTLVYGISKKPPQSVHLGAVQPLGVGNAITYTDSVLGKTEEWKSEAGSEFTVNKNPITNKEANSTIDFLSDSYLLEYDSNSEDFSWGPVSSTSTTPDLYIVKGNTNATQSLNNVTQHYMRLLAQDGAIKIDWDQKSNNKISVDDSTYTLKYDGGNAILTYLHITSNELEVTLE
jgi:hypothetical protein